MAKHFFSPSVRNVFAGGGLTLLLASCGVFNPCVPGETAACCGDCNANGVINSNEALLCAAIYQDEANLPTCPACDCDDDGVVNISELQIISNNTIEGCPK